MKIISTSDWHLGNIFYGNDRIDEHKHFFSWLLAQIKMHQPDALLVSGDVFDNGNPSAAAQEAYYNFLTDATCECPQMQIVITAGNHDSANRLVAPQAILRKHKIEVRGNLNRKWKSDIGEWQIDYDDIIIPITTQAGEQFTVVAIPYLRSDIARNESYSHGVGQILRQATNRARELYPNNIIVMMAHMYAQGADIATCDASERIVIGGQEQVDIGNWPNHPDYLTCGHIHKRQHIWGTQWARYTGSVLPMSFAEKNYTHGVDLVSFGADRQAHVEQLIYTPQHRLRTLPETDEALSVKKLEKLINTELSNRISGKLNNDNFDYVVLRVKLDTINNDDIKHLEDIVNEKNAVLCRFVKIEEQLNLHTIVDNQKVQSIDDILHRNPLDTLKEAYAIKHNAEMNEQQEQMLSELLSRLQTEENLQQ